MPIDPQFLENVRRSGSLLSQILRHLRDHISIGRTGLELEKMTQELLRQSGATAAFQGFQGYPYALCVSHNDEIVHTFPDDRPFQNGDIITVDMGVNFGGAISDAAFTLGLGEITPSARKLIEATETALDKAVKFVRSGVTTRELGAVIEKEIIDRDCTVIPDLCGHGCGHSVHEEPYVFNFPNHAFPDSILKEGQIICIEPIASLGSPKIKTLKNGWTIVTADGSLSAQSEKMVLIQKDGCEVLAGI